LGFGCRRFMVVSHQPAQHGKALTMKSVLAAIALAVLMTFSAASGRAQGQAATPPATPPAADASAPAPAPAGEARPMSPDRQRAPERGDARACLEFPTNLQIIKCAEKYRHMRGPV